MKAPQGKLVNCFPPDTLVGTESGLRPMSQISTGERVWAYDFQSGEWRLCRVECRHDANYDGLLVTLHADAGKVTATAYHPFWVIQGDDLVSRSTPRHVGPTRTRAVRSRPVGELPRTAGRRCHLLEGAWAGDRSAGRAATRADAGVQPDRRDLHTFAVGEMQVLVHNQSGSTPTGGININQKGLQHVLDRHVPGGDAKRREKLI